MNVRAGRFPLFDSMRALAALSVLLFHAALFGGISLHHGAMAPYAARLDVGVTIFFLISGFLLYRPFVRARFEERAVPQVGAYAWRRFLRIVPAYWVALTVVALWLGLSYVFTFKNGPIFYGLAQIYDRGREETGIGQAWTLCVEISFYAFLPLWALAQRACGRGERRVLATELGGLAVLALISGSFKVFALRHTSPNMLGSGVWLMPLPNFLDQFSLGMGLAVLSAWSDRNERTSRRLDALARFPGVWWALAAVAFWAVSTRIGLSGVGDRSTNAEFLARHVLYGVVAFCLLLPVVFGDQRRGAIRRVLSTRPLLYVGLVSYGVYLYHFAVLKTLRDWLDSSLSAGLGERVAIYALLGVAGSVALGSLSYYVVERPALSLKGKFGGLPRADRDEAIGEPAPVGPVSGPGLSDH